MNPKCKKDYSKVPKTSHNGFQLKNRFQKDAPRLSIPDKFKVGDWVTLNPRIWPGYERNIYVVEQINNEYIIIYNKDKKTERGGMPEKEMTLHNKSKNMRTINAFLGIKE